MEFAFPEIAGPMFELVRTVEFDVTIGETGVPIRIELFQAMDDPVRFRARVWQREELKPPAETEAAAKGPERAMPEVLAERPVDLGDDYLDFEAEDADGALHAVLEDLAGRLTPWSASPAPKP
jgi:hypothetical protein